MESFKLATAGEPLRCLKSIGRMDADSYLFFPRLVLAAATAL